MFDSLSDRFETIFTRLRGRGRLSEADVDEVLREIRLALLEADVNFIVVKNFIGRVRDRIVGADLSQSLSPAQQVIKFVSEELTTVLGSDAMSGQAAGQTAEAFGRTLELGGVILTRRDGDARGGAALSVKEVVGKPIAFASVGEKLADFETFHPDRMASRILGMGDVLTLIEKAEQEYDQDVAAKAAAKLQEGAFTLEDFLEQMQQVKKMGPLSGIVGMLPGVPKELKNAQIDDREIARVEAIIRSMTPGERQDPDSINGSRRLRIANGSGSTTSEVNLLLKQFKEVQRMMKGFAKVPGMGRKKGKKGGRVTLPKAQREMTKWQ